ncbi:MAG: cation-transporting P-type ATPase [Pseudomonadota bacterium]|nr:cation-transporting P-type ATPase [Pseudomonadota bacterium]
MRTVPVERWAALPSGDGGLGPADAAVRRSRFGPNDILERAEAPWRELVRATAADPMLWFLVVTSAVYFAVGQRTEGWVLLASTAPLAGMDAWLHHRVTASTRGLGTRLATRARVLRDGTEQDLPAVEVVPGDLVVVRAGEAFPADGIVVAATEAQVDESSLTGESMPVRKHAAAPLPRGTGVLVDGSGWASAGTRLLAGTARVRVVYTGADTVYGGIVRAARATGAGRTPLQDAVARLVGVLVALAVALCALLFAVRLAQGHGWLDALVSAATLAVAALPEEFPVAVAVFLGVGVARLARRRAWVRRAVAVEAIGRVTTICTDKTGTLTEGRLRLAHLLPMPGVTEGALLALATRACRRETGDPLDEALLEAGHHADPAALATFPFTEARRRETRIVQDGEALLAVTKGAPETVLARCDDDRAAPLARAQVLAAEGHKVIAVASRPVASPTREPDDGYRLAGLVAFEDPVRDGVAEAVATCRAAGIRVLMVTGDHPATAGAVARELGLGGGRPTVVEGEELATLASMDGIDVVARALPAHKLAIVERLRRGGEVVAVTGDGVNDVPALQAADIGIAMGERGTGAAREAAAIVLADDNFRTVVAAVAEGRQLLRNLRRSFQYLLMVHLPLFATATLLPLLGYPLLYEPVHVVWLEALIHPSALIAFQDAAPPGGLGERPPRGAVRLFSRARGVEVLAVAVGLTVVVTWSWLRGLADPADVAHARALAMAAMATGSAATVAFLSGLRSPASRIVTAAGMAGSVVLLYVPALAQALHMTPPHPADWLLVCAASGMAVALPLAISRLYRTRRRPTEETGARRPSAFPAAHRLRP